MNRRIDRYQLLEQIGTGGMAVVYRGRDTVLDREVAVKVLHPHLGERPESRARFSREARAVARLSHPNIVEIFDCGGETAEAGWIVTEFVRGPTLRTFAEEEGFGYPEIGVLVGRALADALAHAHAAGVIHRDLKPENVLVSREPGKRLVKLADFGIARILSSDERMTMTGALVGSPNHMAPEIVAGGEADARSDLFSLGTILYWLVTGRLPFAAPNPTATLRRLVEGDYQDPRLANPLVSDRLAVTIRQALAPAPAQRPASAAALRESLDQVLAEAGISEPASELAAFLADPPAYRQAFPPRTVDALVAAGEKALGQGSAARALGLFSRALSLCPDHPRVLGHLQRIQRRAATRRWAKLAGALLGAGLLAALGWNRLGQRVVVSPGEADAEREIPPPALSSLSPPRSEDPTSSSLFPAGEEGHREEATHRAAPPPSSVSRAKTGGQRPAASAAAPAAMPVAAGLTVHVRPYAERALLDGVEVAHGAQQVTFALSPGRSHVIQIEHPCCRPYVRRIQSAEMIHHPELRIPLEPKPALLRVEGDPATRVYVEGALLGTAGDSQRAAFPVPIPPGDSPYEGQVQVRLELPGTGEIALTTRLRAGNGVVIPAPWKEAR